MRTNAKKLSVAALAGAVALVGVLAAPPVIALAEGTAITSAGVTERGMINTIHIHRLYNPYTGEHFYTPNTQERDDLVLAGWRYEGVGWSGWPESASRVPVYRLYNPYVPGGDHHYTTDQNEYEQLQADGWQGEGICWYSDRDPSEGSPDVGPAPFYRLYNPNAITGAHHYTMSESERDSLIVAGWKDEGTGFWTYGWVLLPIDGTQSEIVDVACDVLGVPGDPFITYDLLETTDWPDDNLVYLVMFYDGDGERRAQGSFYPDGTLMEDISTIYWE